MYAPTFASSPANIEVVTSTPLKRKAFAFPTKAKKHKKDSSQPKHPLMRLNELKPGLKFEFSIEGEKGPPFVFVATLDLDNKVYIGRGPSKKEAKLVIAQTLLKEMGLDPGVGELPSTTTEGKVASKHPVSLLSEIYPGINFEVVRENLAQPLQRYTLAVTVNDKRYEGSGSNKKLAKAAAAKAALDDLLKSNTDLKSLKDARKPPKPQKTNGSVQISKESRLAKMPPSMILHQINPLVQYEFVREDALIPGQRFTMAVTINDKRFEGSGATKKAAKTAAARAALCDIFQINYCPEEMDKSIEESFNQKFPQRVADKIAQAVYSKFQEITLDKYTWRVLAGIAMTSDAEMNDVTVIALATGAGGKQNDVCPNGEAISDTHAEVLVRRCFKSYLYSQLELLINHSTQNNSIFTKADKGGFCLKPHIKFHLFITSSPCGAAKIIPPRKGETAPPINEKQGSLHVKTGLFASTPISKVEISEGKRKILNMSCSDKIASWNVVGLQGALLGYFIFPIYLDTIILGNYFDPHHMTNAMWGRVENIASDLVPPFRLNKPNVCCTTSHVTKKEMKIPLMAINWVPAFKDKCEEIVVHTGKTKVGAPSHICKKSLFAKFLHLCTWLPGIVDDTKAPKNYATIKAQVKDYHCAKEKFKKALEENGLGSWIKKPIEQGNFELAMPK